MFGGLISAFTIIRSSALHVAAAGPAAPARSARPRSTPRRCCSRASVLYLAQRAYTRDRARALRPLGISLLLGAFFVLFQGAEWVALIRAGADAHLEHARELLLPDRRHARAARGGRARAARLHLAAAAARLAGPEPARGRRRYSGTSWSASGRSSTWWSTCERRPLQNRARRLGDRAGRAARAARRARPAPSAPSATTAASAGS